MPAKSAWLTWLDLNIGEMRRKLEQLGELDNTIVVVTSDHGSWRHGKTTLYEGGVRVPLVIHWPRGLKARGTCSGLVQNIDLTPTLLELAGVRPPSDLQCDGQSIAPLIRGDDNALHEDLFFELGFARGIVTTRWKYIAIRYDEETQTQIERGKTFAGWNGVTQELPFLIRNSHLGFHAAKYNSHYFESDQLYDLTNDPREERNVADEYPEQLAEMQSKLRRYLQSFRDRPFGEFTQPMITAYEAN